MSELSYFGTAIIQIKPMVHAHLKRCNKTGLNPFILQKKNIQYIFIANAFRNEVEDNNQIQAIIERYCFIIF